MFELDTGGMVPLKELLPAILCSQTVRQHKLGKVYMYSRRLCAEKDFGNVPDNELLLIPLYTPTVRSYTMPGIRLFTEWTWFSKRRFLMEGHQRYSYCQVPCRKLNTCRTKGEAHTADWETKDCPQTAESCLTNLSKSHTVTCYFYSRFSVKYLQHAKVHQCSDKKSQTYIINNIPRPHKSAGSVPDSRFWSYCLRQSTYVK